MHDGCKDQTLCPPVKVKVMLIDAKFTKDIELPGNGHDSSTMRHV